MVGGTRSCCCREEVETNYQYDYHANELHELKVLSSSYTKYVTGHVYISWSVVEVVDVEVFGGGRHVTSISTKLWFVEPEG